MASTAPKQSKTAKQAPPPEPDIEPEKAAAPKKRKKRSLLKTALLATPLLCVAAGAAWYFLGDHDPEAAPPPKAAKSAVRKADNSRPPMFVPLESFTVNLQFENNAQQYLQVGLSLKVLDDEHIGAVKLHMPEIRNRVLLLLSSKKASELASLEGKKTLSDELRKEIVQPLAGRVPGKWINSVLFTSFVVQ